METILESLKKDHRKVESLFERLESSKEETDRGEIFGELASELETHATAEEDVLYPRAEKMEEIKYKIKHSYEEHNEIRDLISEIESLDSDDEDWTEKVIELKETVAHHVEEEEHTIFPKLEKLFTTIQLREMGEQLQQTKHRLAAA